MDVVYFVSAAAGVGVAYCLTLAALCTEEEIGYSLRLTGRLLGLLIALYFAVCLVGYVVVAFARPDLLPH
jgi:hypothetical protein